MRFWTRWLDRRLERRMAREWEHKMGHDRPLAERAAEARRLSVGAPVIVHRIRRRDPDA
jgi:hypothetical protein